jgi:hypothetical protein
MHRLMMLEDGVQPHHGDSVAGELLVDALRLRHAVEDATRAVHLEGMQCGHPATQAEQVQRRLGVEPLDHLPGGAAG